MYLRVFVPLYYIFPAAMGEEQVRGEGVWEPLAHRHQQLWKTQCLIRIKGTKRIHEVVCTAAVMTSQVDQQRIFKG